MQVCRTRENVLVRLEDDGRGVDLSDWSERPEQIHGLGLTSMTERARILGGRLRCESSPGHGFRLNLELPLRLTGSGGKT
jgi:signal transduction histidine kinase